MATRPSPIQIPSTSLRRRGHAFARAGQTFRVEADSGLIELFDQVGQPGITAAQFSDKLKSLNGKSVTVQINSPGGDVFEGIAIYNALARYPGNVSVEVVGIAASAASIIAMAGDEISIASNAHVMVHNAWALTVGNSADHTGIATVLSKIDSGLAKTYSERTGQKVGAVNKWMAAETWFTADEAIEAGFADRIIDDAEPQASFDLAIYANVPDNLKVTPPKDRLNDIDLERALRAKGFTHSAARRISQGELPSRDQPIAAKIDQGIEELRQIRGK